MTEHFATFGGPIIVKKYLLIAIASLVVCSMAAAQDVVLSGQVQRVILEPSGTEFCPPPCPINPPVRPDGRQTVCISNRGGCQTMEVKIDHVYRGATQGEIRKFTSRIGEWGRTFPNTAQRIVVSEEAGNVSWSLATERDGKTYIDPKQLRFIGGLATTTGNESDLVALDEVLARSVGRR
jgi:hypothetical protein